MAVAEPLNTTPVIYDAFISYSHAKDKPIATALQSVVQKIGKAWYRRRALRVFRDDTSLSATPHLWPSIEQALGQSRFLILLASPEAAASRWVGQEIAYWLDHKSADTVLIALTEGELDWDQATSDFRWSLTPPLPAALKNRFASEPRWIDLRPYRGGSISMGTEFMGLGADFAAAIHGIPKEDLLSEEVRQQRRARTLAGTAATLLVALLVAAGWQWRVAETQRGIAEAQTKVAEAQTKVAEAQTKEAQTQRNEAQLQRDKARAELLAMQARRAYTGAKSTDDIELAGALALESIEIARNSNRPAEEEAIEAAKSALVGLSFPVLSHGSPVSALAVLADGRLASGGSDLSGNGNIKIWPKEGTGEPVVLSNGSPVTSLAVLPDGRLASGGEDGNIKIWPKEGRGEPTVLSHGSPVSALAVLADGRLASGGDDIKIWPKQGHDQPVTLSQGHRVTSLAVLPDGRLASGDVDGNIKIWPKEGKGKPVALPPVGSVSSLAVLADGRLASGDTSGNIEIWPKEGKGNPVVLSHGVSPSAESLSWVGSLVVLADGRLVSSGDDIKIWSKKGTGEPVVLAQSRGIQVRALAALKDGRLASGEDGGNIKIWRADEPVVLSNGRSSRFSDDPGLLSVRHLAVLADGRLASASEDGTIKIWSRDEPVVLAQGTGQARQTRALTALNDGRLASGDTSGNIEIWPKEGKGDPVVFAQSSSVDVLAVLADGRLASGDFMGGNIKIWPKEGRGEPVVLAHRSVVALAVLPDGRLVGGGGDGNIKIWSKEGRGEPTVLSHGSPVSALAVLADGRLASGGSDLSGNGNIKIWPKEGNGKPVVLAQSNWVLSLAVLADGRLASGGADRSVKIWPKEGTGDPVVLSNGSSVTSLAVLPDGRLASGDVDGTIKLWFVDEQKLINALCLRAGRNLTKEEWARYVGTDTPWQPSCRDRPSNWQTLDP
jgi:WD40 repeat protein